MRSKADISRGPARGNQVKKKKINQRTNFAPKYHNKDLFTGTGGKVAYNSTQVEENNVIRWIKFHEISFSSVLNVYAWTIYIKNQKYIAQPPLVVPLDSVLTCQLDRVNASLAPTAVWISRNGESYRSTHINIIIIDIDNR